MIKSIVLLAVGGVCLLLLGGSVAWADAPQQSGLGFGESVEGTISNLQFRQVYNFDGRQGQVVTVRMTRTGGDLDPYLLLMTQNGTLVAFSDDADERNAEITSQSLPQDGAYTIIATRFGHEHGTTEGDYLLNLESIGSVVAVPNAATTVATDTSPANTSPSTTTTMLRYGDEVSGQITDEQPYVIYRFAAQRGDVVNLAMIRINGNLDPLIDLFDPNGNYLFSGDDDELGTLNAAIRNYIIPTDGVYYVQATRYGRIEGVSTGLYTVRLDAVPVEQLGTRPSNARVLSLPAAVSSSITEDTLTRFFQIEAQRGDIVSVIATRASGDLIPRVNFLRNDLSQMATSVLNDDEDVATIGGVTVQEDGIYYISVGRAGSADAETLGDFSLLVERRPSIMLGDAVEIVYGGQVIGTINDQTIEESFVFVGAADDVVTISMVRTNGDLDALLTLRNADGKQLTSDDDGYAEGRKDSLIDGFVLPADGMYFVEASRYERAEGETSGDYVLELTAVVATTEN